MNSVLHDPSRDDPAQASSATDSISDLGDEKHGLLTDQDGDAAASFDEDGRPLAHRRRARRASRALYLTAANLFMCLVSVTLFSIWYSKMHLPRNPILRQWSSYTPILDRIDLPLEVKLLNGTLYPNQEPSVGRQMPNDEADKLWEEWEIGRIIPVTADDIRRMGKDPSTVAKLDDDIYGLGDDAYATIFDVFHQLHCLNMLRHYAYPDAYPAAWKHENISTTMRDIHTNHCVDMLMQAIQCSGNLNLITMHWVENEPWPFPDMSTNRQCIDFDYLTRWRIDNAVDVDLYINNSDKPDGVKELRAPDAYYEFFNPHNLTNPNHINGANPDDDFNL